MTGNSSLGAAGLSDTVTLVACTRRVRPRGAAGPRPPHSTATAFSHTPHAPWLDPCAPWHGQDRGTPAGRTSTSGAHRGDRGSPETPPPPPRDRPAAGMPAHADSSARTPRPP